MGRRQPHNERLIIREILRNNIKYIILYMNLIVAGVRTYVGFVWNRSSFSHKRERRLAGERCGTIINVRSLYDLSRGQFIRTHRRNLHFESGKKSGDFCESMRDRVRNRQLRSIIDRMLHLVFANDPGLVYGAKSIQSRIGANASCLRAKIRII